MAERAVGVDEGGRGDLPARHARVLGAFPAADAERAAAGQAYYRSPDTSAFTALLDDLQIHPIAGMADAALGPSGHDARVVPAAAGARPAR